MWGRASASPHSRAVAYGHANRVECMSGKKSPRDALSAADLSRVSGLLLALHRSASDLSQLGDFLKRANDLFGASSTVLSIVEPGDSHWRFMDVYPRIPEQYREYEQRYASGDPVRAALARVPPGTPVLLTDLFSPEAQGADSFFTGMLAGKWGYRDVLAVRLVVEESFGCYLGLTRSVGQPLFEPRDRERLALLVPHLQRWVSVQAGLDQLGMFSGIALEQMLQTGQGLAVLGEDGAVVYLNRVAARLTRDEEFFDDTARRLELAEPALRGDFRALVDRCIAASRDGCERVSGTMSVPRAASASMDVVVMSLRRPGKHTNLLAAGGRAIVATRESGRPRHDIRQQLSAIYGLSEAEAEVCWRISNGDSVAGIAGATGSTKDAVRSQLKRVFQKTGVRRQPDLVRLVLLGPAAWLRLS